MKLAKDKNAGKAIIKSVAPGSLAEEGGIAPGDILLSVNGKKINDIFDYRYLISDNYVLLYLSDSEGEEYDVEIEKEEYEDLGIEFVNPMIGQDRGCANKCIFCFIDQMPEGMRQTLYFKDDDTRLSFLTGNYVTLTNIGSRELKRIIEYRMSPINISVHTTDPKLRTFMLGNRNAGKIMDQLSALDKACITVNAQIVLCPGINDGEHLVKTVKDLYSFKNSVASVSAVPVGITKFREGLYDLRTYTPEECRGLISTIEGLQREFYNDSGRNFVYIADEIYLKAGIEMPEYDSYDDFPQLENGVGMCRLLDHETVEYINSNKKGLQNAIKNDTIRKDICLATGVEAFDFIKNLAKYVTDSFNIPERKVIKVENDFFGHDVTVSGLITGQDLVKTVMENKKDEQILLVTQNMFRSGENVFLDDMTLEQAEQALNMKIIPVPDSGKDFTLALLKGCIE